MRQSFRAALLGGVLVVLAAPSWAADPIFNVSVLHEVRLTLDPAEWQALKDNFRANTYYAANASFDGEVLQQVGIRSRGKGSRSPVKPGIKVEFDKYIKTQLWHGTLKSVALKNVVQDNSMIRESLAMPVFEAMGLAAPKVAFARVTVNEEYYGIYNIVEGVEEAFLQSRYGEQTGNLYKLEFLSPYYFTDKGSDLTAYVDVPLKRETNKDGDAHDLIAFIKAMNGGSDATFTSDIGKYLDVQKFLTYIAVENALAESDGLLGTEGPNNFFMYQFTGGTKFEFIAWDKNTSFQSPNWPLFRNSDIVAIAKRLLADPAQKAFYVSMVKKAVTSFVNTAYLSPSLEANYSLIRNSALTDTKKPYSNDDFELSIAGLRGIIAGRQADVQAQAPQ